MGINPIKTFAESKIGTKLYKWAASEKGQKWLCNSLPTCETVLSTAIYISSTEHQKNLDRREKNVLQWQNVLSGVLGAIAGTYLNRKVSAFGDEILRYVDPKKVPDVHKIQGAIRVLLPLLTTAFLMRFCAPVVTAYASGEIEERRSKIDVKA
jgi:hypothetical protein